VQELHKQRKHPNRYDEVGLFSGILFCADCGLRRKARSPVYEAVDRADRGREQTPQRRKESSNQGWLLSGVLYMVSPDFYKILQENKEIISLFHAIIIAKNAKKFSIYQYFKLFSRHY
jgi:hypothetical protein